LHSAVFSDAGFYLNNLERTRSSAGRPSNHGACPPLNENSGRIEDSFRFILNKTLDEVESIILDDFDDSEKSQ
jgi:hypothetical protein